MTARRSLSNGVRARVFERDGFRCRRCGRGPQECPLVVDHIVPVVKGGSNDEANLQTLCADCNAGKFDRAPHAHDLTPPTPAAQDAPATLPAPARASSLVGQWAIMPRGDRPAGDWEQGKILSEPAPGVYSVAVFSHVDGAPLFTRLVPVETIGRDRWELFQDFAAFDEAACRRFARMVGR